MKTETYLVLVRNSERAQDPGMQQRVATELLALSKNKARRLVAADGVICLICKADPHAITDVLKDVTRDAHWLVAPIPGAFSSCGLTEIGTMLGYLDPDPQSHEKSP